MALAEAKVCLLIRNFEYYRKGFRYYRYANSIMFCYLCIFQNYLLTLLIALSPKGQSSSAIRHLNPSPFKQQIETRIEEKRCNFHVRTEIKVSQHQKEKSHPCNFEVLFHYGKCMRLCTHIEPVVTPVSQEYFKHFKFQKRKRRKKTKIKKKLLKKNSKGKVSKISLSRSLLCPAKSNRLLYLTMTINSGKCHRVQNHKNGSAKEGR